MLTVVLSSMRRISSCRLELCNVLTVFWWLFLGGGGGVIQSLKPHVLKSSAQFHHDHLKTLLTIRPYLICLPLLLLF